jgi:hypothetical protein
MTPTEALYQPARTSPKVTFIVGDHKWKYG